MVKIAIDAAQSILDDAQGSGGSNFSFTEVADVVQMASSVRSSHICCSRSYILLSLRMAFTVMSDPEVRLRRP